MKLNHFCSKCGKNIDKSNKKYQNFLCGDCSSINKIDLGIEFKIILRKCVDCGAFSLKYDSQEFKWIFKSEDTSEVDYLTQILYENIFDKIEKKNKINYSLFFEQSIDLTQITDINLLIKVQETEIYKEIQNSVIIKIKEIHCEHCARRLGGRFDAILQVRIQHETSKLKQDQILENCYKIENEENFDNPKCFISKIDKSINGFDVKVSNNGFLRTLVSRLREKYHFQIKQSKKLMGKNNETGADLYRQKILLKLIPVVKNDKIILDNNKYYVKNITRNKVVLKNIETQKISQLNFSVFEKKKWKFINIDES
jgi:60S ribosomal export protein NMD3